MMCLVPYRTLVTSPNDAMNDYYEPHFTDEEKGDQREEAVFPNGARGCYLSFW